MKNYTCYVYIFAVLLFCVTQTKAQNFVTTWETTAASETITIPTSGTGYLYDVDWENDGTFDDIGLTGDATHTFATAGVQTIAIRGDFPRIFFNNAGDKDKIIIVNEWGNIAWTSMANAFEGCTNLVIAAPDTPNLSGVTDMSAMFKDATSFNTPIGNWTVSNITNMDNLFDGATSFDQNIGAWDVSNVTSMASMFANTGLSSSNYDSLLIGWAALTLQSTVNFDAGTSEFCFGATAKTTIETTYNWIIADGGENCADTFITTWQTDNPGTSAMNEITIPTTGTGYLYDVDWGDGSISTNVTGTINHSYAVPGTVTVKIRGSFPRIFFNNTGDKDKLLSVDNWGAIAWTSMEGAFYGCENIAVVAPDAPDLSGVTSMRQLFKGAITFNDDISSWDVITITDMSELFNEALVFNQNISAWTVDNVENMEAIFAQSSFDQPIGGWSVTNVQTMESMFADTPFNQDLSTWVTTSLLNTDSMFANATLFNQDISSWDVSGVDNMQGMFLNAEAFNQPIGSWIVSSALNMEGMFSNADAFNQPIGNWLVGNVENMSGMFTNAVSFNQDIGMWNVGMVTDMSNMFNGAISFNQDLNLWNVALVEDMSAMFSGAEVFNGNITSWVTTSLMQMPNMFNGAKLFNQDIGNWTTSSVVNMRELFTGAEVFDQDIGGWDVALVSDMENMFSGAQLSIDNYDALLIGWEASGVQNGILFNGGTSTYCVGVSARDTLINTNGWTITDAGSENVPPVPDSASLPPINSECAVTTLTPPTATDVCAGVITATTTDLPVENQGLNIITWTYDDGNGNLVTQNQEVTITDTTNPTVVNASGDQTETTQVAACGNNVTFVEPTFSDNCTFSVTSTHLPGDFFPVGDTQVVYTATDTAGNSTDVSIIITVVDDVDPSFSGCPTSFSINADVGSCGAIVNFTEPIASDNCFVSVTSTHNPGQFFPVGITTVTYVASDNSGNSVSCVFDITVQDTIDPVFSNCPSNIIVSSDIGSCGATVTYTPPSVTDNCGATVISTNNSGDFFSVGVTTVAYTATDAAGNNVTCSFDITVEDTTDPVISSCPFNITQNADPGVCSAVVTWTPPLQTDNCSAILTTTHNPGDTFLAGVTTVVYTATDPAGNTDTCSFTVTITENEAPVITNCPTDITIGVDAGVCSAVVSWIPPSQTDNCGASFSSTSVPGDTFPVGTTIVDYVATDSSGNSATCSFMVTVVDDKNPTLTACPSDIVVDNDVGMCDAIVSWIPPIAADNCAVALVASHDPGDVFLLGTTTVTYTATDDAGNVVDCSFTVTVNDAEMPVISNCPVDIVVSNDLGQCEANVFWTAPTAIDNCVGLTLSSTHVSGDMFPVGTTSVTYTALDDAGNSTLCTFTITVEDTELPEITCIVDPTVFVDGAPYELPDYFADGIISTTDNCTMPVTMTAQVPAPGTFLDPGSYNIELRATDDAGNVANCMFTLTVEAVLGISSETLNLESISLYPNPTESVLNIENPQQIALKSIQIFDIAGRVVKELTNMTGTQLTIDVSELASATYMVLFATEKGLYTKQLIKE